MCTTNENNQTYCQTNGCKNLLCMAVHIFGNFILSYPFRCYKFTGCHTPCSHFVFRFIINTFHCSYEFTTDSQSTTLFPICLITKIQSCVKHPALNSAFVHSIFSLSFVSIALSYIFYDTYIDDKPLLLIHLVCSPFVDQYYQCGLPELGYLFFGPG